MRHSRVLTLAFLALALAYGCAPVISKEKLDAADRNIKFSDVVKDPSAYTGKTVLVGGEIVSVENRENRTIIEVLEEPLSRSLKPVAPDESQGRFLAVFEGFKDPAVYAKGRLITMTGRITGSEKRPLGNIEYGYPVISPTEHYIWRAGAEREPQVGVGLGIGVIHGF